MGQRLRTSTFLVCALALGAFLIGPLGDGAVSAARPAHHRTKPRKRRHRRARRHHRHKRQLTHGPEIGVPAAGVPAGATWFSSFEDPNPWSKWEGYDKPLLQLQRAVQPGQIAVVDSASRGIEPPPGYRGSAKVLDVHVNESQYDPWWTNFPNELCCVHAKLYHTWGGNTGPGDGPALQPGQESGSYRAWFYLPSSQTPTFPQDGSNVRWVMLTEWKSREANGSEYVVGGAGLLPVNGTVWMYFGFWNDHWPPSEANGCVKAPLDRWFELREDVNHSTRSADFYIDGRHVGRTTNMHLLDPSADWTFGLGHYGGVGGYYVKNASFTPFR